MGNVRGEMFENIPCRNLPSKYEQHGEEYINLNLHYFRAVRFPYFTFDVPFSYLACRCMCNTSSMELRSYWDDLARRISQSVFYNSKAFSHKHIERHTAHTIVS